MRRGAAGLGQKLFAAEALTIVLWLLPTTTSTFSICNAELLLYTS